MSDSVVKLDAVVFSYGSHVILDHVNLRIERNDFVAITGANGSGKSTVLKLSLGLLRPDQGTVSLLGGDVQRFDEHARIGYVYQEGISSIAAFPASVLETVSLKLPGNSVVAFNQRKRLETARAMLEVVGLEHQADDPLATLSGGQLQRALIARELILKPDVLFLDEPTTGLDDASVDQLFALLKKLNESSDLTVVVVTHDIEQLARYFNRIVRVSDQKIVEVL